MRFFRSKKMLIISICTVVLLGAGGSLAYYFYLSGAGGDKTKSVTTEKTPDPDALRPDPNGIIATNTKAQDAYSAGDVAGALKQYDEAIAKNTDPAEIAELTRYKATVYINEGQYDEAITQGKKSDELHPTRFSAELIGNAYQRMGNKTEAIRYYNLAITRIATDGYINRTLNDESYYNILITRASA